MEILLENGIYFDKINDVFEMFIIHDDWLFYRLKPDYIENGYKDPNEHLIEPCENYDKMVCLVKIYNYTVFESIYWVDNETFNENKENKTLGVMVKDIVFNDTNFNNDSNETNFIYGHSSSSESN